MEIKKYLDKSLICLIKGKNKEETVLELVELVAKTGRIQDMETLKESLFYREGLMSTGIGLSIGIPHVRHEGVGNPIVAVGIKKEGISDYETIDKEKVKIVFLIIVEKGKHKVHIKLLSEIVTLLKADDLRKQLIESRSVDELFENLLQKT